MKFLAIFEDRVLLLVTRCAFIHSRPKTFHRISWQISLRFVWGFPAQSSDKTTNESASMLHGYEMIDKITELFIGG